MTRISDGTVCTGLPYTGIRTIRRKVSVRTERSKVIAASSEFFDEFFDELDEDEDGEGKCDS